MKNRLDNEIELKICSVCGNVMAYNYYFQDYICTHCTAITSDETVSEFISKLLDSHNIDYDLKSGKADFNKSSFTNEDFDKMFKELF